MKRKLFQGMFVLALLMMALVFCVFLYAPKAWETRVWLLVGLVLLAALLAFCAANAIVYAVTKSLRDARLEDLETQTLVEELRPLAGRMLEQNRQVQKQLQKQNAELRRVYEKQDRMRRDFTANVSHELKTPLTSISGYAEIIRNGIVKEEDIGRFAGKIYNETQRLIALVEDILKLSQLDEGHQVRMERSVLDLYDCCKRVIARLQTSAEQRGIHFTLSGNRQEIVGVEKIVEEIIYNLCDNAIKYNQPNGSINVSVLEQADKVLLCVQDTGIGISIEEQERVFERFYRVDKSHSKEIGGTGLGLSIVKHGALFHDARIELTSTLGEGTEFRVLFDQKEATEHERRH